MIEDSFNSRVKVTKSGRVNRDGSLVQGWAIVPGMAYVPCRLDVNFIRPGKQTPPPQEAGKAPDREGTAFFGLDFGGRIAPMWRVTAVMNDDGIIPVAGTFEIRAWPDAAQDMDGPQHYEVSIYEVAAMVVSGSL